MTTYRAALAALALSTAIGLAPTSCRAGDAADAEAVAKLQDRLRRQEILIERLERRLECDEALIPYTNIRLSPTLMEWNNLLRDGRKVNPRCWRYEGRIEE